MCCNSWQDKEIKYIANNNLKLLAAGILPSEFNVVPKLSHSVAAGESISLFGTVEDLRVWNLCPRTEAAAQGYRFAAKEGASKFGILANSMQRKSVVAGSRCSSPCEIPDSKGDEDLSDVGDSAGEEEDINEARETEHFGISDRAKERLTQVTRTDSTYTYRVNRYIRLSVRRAEICIRMYTS